MNLKTSLFNKAIFNTNIKRYGFIFAIYIFITEVFIDYIYLGYNNVSSTGIDGNYFYYYNFTDDIGFYYLFSISVLAVVMSMLLFHYIQKENPMTTIHAMPVSRKSIYCTNYLVFTALMGLSLLINSITLSLHIIIGKGFPAGEVFASMGIRFLINMLLALAIFSFSTLMGMIISNFILQGGFVMLFFGLPILVDVLFDSLFNIFLIGYDSQFDFDGIFTRITPYYFLADINQMYRNVGGYGNDSGFLDFDISAFSIVLSLGLFIFSILLAYYLYEKRDLEKCTDFIVFNWAKRVLNILMSALLSLILANMFGMPGREIYASNIPAYVGAFTGAFLGYVIMKLIEKKSVNVFKFIPKSLVFGLVAAILVFVLDMDILGYETYTPNIDEVDIAYASNVFSNKVDIENNYPIINYRDRGIARLSGADVEVLKEEHLRLADEVKGRGAGDYYSSINIIYQLKSGKTINRKYHLATEEYHDFMDKLLPLASNMELLSSDYDLIMKMYKSSDSIVYGENEQQIALTAAQKDDLLAQHKKDYLNIISSSEKEREREFSYEIYLSPKTEEKMQLNVYENYSNTLTWIEKNLHFSNAEVAKEEKNLTAKVVEIYAIDENGEELLLLNISDSNIISRLSSINYEASSDELEFEPYRIVKFKFADDERLVYLTREVLENGIADEIYEAINAVDEVF